MIDCLKAAVKDAIDGKIAAIVTAPVNKAIINEAPLSTILPNNKDDLVRKARRVESADRRLRAAFKFVSEE